jgi:hypothetical protein
MSLTIQNTHGYVLPRLFSCPGHVGGDVCAGPNEIFDSQAAGLLIQ